MDKYQLYAGDSILTFSGHYLDVFDPDPDCICIEDIAHALSQIPRFGGHLIRPLSVAEHSILVAYKVPTELALDALLHDASEAYLMDIPSPIKRRLPDYKKLEESLTKVINAKFGIAYPKPPLVKAADIACLERTGKHCYWVNDEETLCSACVKVFKRYPPERVPPQSSCENRRESDISDRFFAIVRNMDEEEKMSLIAWDFRNQKWKSPVAGRFTVIEYYEVERIEGVR